MFQNMNQKGYTSAYYTSENVILRLLRLLELFFSVITFLCQLVNY